MAFHDFPKSFAGARIFPENRWVQLSERLPWTLIDEKYAENFEGKGGGNGNVAVSSRVARKSDLTLVRNKRPGVRLIRKTLRSQLQFLRRNLGHIERMAETTPLSEKERQELLVIQAIYEQQQEMYTNRRRTVENRQCQPAAHSPDRSGETDGKSGVWRVTCAES